MADDPGTSIHELPAPLEQSAEVTDQVDEADEENVTLYLIKPAVSRPAWPPLPLSTEWQEETETTDAQAA